MKLYLFPGACSSATHIALRWSGQPFEIEILTPDRLRSPEFLRINPAGTVPALVDGDFVLTQNTAILGYIADRFPQAKLLGDGSARQRAEATRWLMLGNTDMHPLFGTFFAPGIHIADAAQHGALQAASRARLRGMFERADAQFEGRDWIAGFRSVADAYLYVMLLWAQMHRIDLDGLERLAAFRLRMDADSGVQAALRAEGLLPPMHAPDSRPSPREAAAPQAIHDIA